MMISGPVVSTGGEMVSVAYLSGDREYPPGEVSGEVFERRVAMVDNPIGFWCGHHDCDLDPCGSGSPVRLEYRGQSIPPSVRAMSSGRERCPRCPGVDLALHSRPQIPSTGRICWRCLALSAARFPRTRCSDQISPTQYDVSDL